MHYSRPIRISDELWAQIAPIIPCAQRDTSRCYQRKQGAGRKRMPARRIFEAIMHVLRSGIAWKSLPPAKFGSPSAIHRYFMEWSAQGFFHQIWKRGLAQHPDLEGIAWKWRASAEPVQDREPASAAAKGRRKSGNPRRVWEPARCGAAFPDTEEADDAIAPRGKWGKICALIRLDILNGAYSRGALLPSQKVLVHRYGISYPTLRKCLDQLEDDGLVTPYKRGYLVPTFGPASPGARLTLIWRGLRRDEKTGEAPFDELEEMFIRFLESETLKAGIALDTLSYFSEEDGETRFYRRESLQPCELRDHSDVRGYIILVITPSAIPAAVLAALRSFEKPVAIVDQIGDAGIREMVRRTPGFRIFTTRGGMRPGRDVGRFLLSLGHRRIAYISPFHDDAWSQLRHQGICREYARVGLDAAVNACVITENLHDPEAGEAWIPMREGARRFGLAQFLQTFDQWLAGKPHSLSRKVDAYFRNWVSIACGVEEACSRLLPLLEETLAQRAITAWVASGDMVAQYLLEYLAGKGVAIPGSISLVSFDNTIRSLRQGITSYSFGEPALAASVLNYILRPADTGEVQRRNVVQVPGVVVERATTAPAREAN